MKKLNLGIFVSILLILALSAIVFATIEVFIFKNSTLSLEEGGLLEFMQVVMLVASVMLYIPAIIKNKGGERWISLCFATIFYLFILRELEIKHMDVPDYVKYIFHGTGRTITASVLIGAALIGALTEYKYYTVKTVSLLFSKRGALLWLSFAFLQVGQWVEKMDFKYNIYGEEVLELIGYCFILLCASSTKKLPNCRNNN